LKVSVSNVRDSCADALPFYVMPPLKGQPVSPVILS